MLKISALKVENFTEPCVTDTARPRFSFSLQSDKNGVTLNSALISVNGWSTRTKEQIAVTYGGEELKPFTEYKVNVTAEDNYKESAQAQTYFRTGRLNESWHAGWITRGSYRFNKKKCSPRVIVFRKDFSCKKIKSAFIYSTALGIYELTLNGEKIGKDYFSPGFTSYKNQLQYQTYDITQMIKDENTLCAFVAGGWAAGKFTHCLRNRIFVPRQAFLAEIRIEYADNTSQIIGTDTAWSTALDGPFKSADFYDGEIFDAQDDIEKLDWQYASIEKIKIKPKITASYGPPVRAHEEFDPVSVTQKGGKLIYDFGQNFAGVICARIRGERGQKIIFKHAEVLMDGDLFLKPLRSAKAQAVYICKGRTGDDCIWEEYSPRFTYMGFRYVSAEGVKEENLDLKAVSLYSDIKTTGYFSCSDERINRLQQNIVWSAKSNFIDIPTDCPQRDERMGWTGDIALFAPAAAFNFDMASFFEKWLCDLRTDQKKTGGVPVTIPHTVFPSNLESVFTMAVDHWGDACVLVPWAEYLARGDISILQKSYASMKKYLKACKFWAGFFSFSKVKRRIWSFGHHYGDWCAPELGLFDWMRRGKWTATACFAYSCGIVSKIAGLLGMDEDEKNYFKLSSEIANAYLKIFTDGKGKLKNEFQSGYVLPLYYSIFIDNEKKAAAENLALIVKRNNYKIGTGFPGTPYILFALSDNGQEETAFKMLTNEECPSWLFQVKAGGTTIWERWDALRPDGSSNTGSSDGTKGMVSFNHYANGAAGSFLYRRIAGIEPLTGGYKSFCIRPVIGGGITSAQAKVMTPYGEIVSRWEINGNEFTIDVSIPVDTECLLTLPDSTQYKLTSGIFAYRCNV